MISAFIGYKIGGTNPMRKSRDQVERQKATLIAAQPFSDQSPLLMSRAT